MPLDNIVHWNKDFYPNSGGGPTHIASLIVSMGNSNHIVVTDDTTGLVRKEDFTDNSKIIRFPNKISKNYSSNIRILQYLVDLFHEVRCVNEKIRYLKSGDYEILHVHGLGLYPCLKTLNKYFLFDIYNTILSFSRIDKAKVLTLHNLMITNKVVKKIYDNYFKQFKFIICVDESIYEYVRARCALIQFNTKVFYIPNGIEIDKFNKNNRISTKRFTVGFVGRVASTVDTEMLKIVALSLPQDIQFKFVISGDVDQVIGWGLPKNVIINIDIENNRMPEFYKEIDVLFNPILHNAISRVTLESMSCGIPVIMYDATSRSKYFSNDNIVEVPRDLEAIMNKIEFLREQHQVRGIIGDSASDLIKKRFSSEITSKQVLRVYTKALIEFKV
jgi:glycosyltransferase involved in cell wall biosynthesis